jgi:hypothetical protein
MAVELLSREAVKSAPSMDANSVPSNVVEIARPDVARMSQIVSAVRGDSLSAPKNYLDETLVPFGGE